jgi:hypothetical protein
MVKLGASTLAIVVMSMSFNDRKIEISEVLPRSRLVLLLSYVAVAIFLLFIEACDDIYETIFEFRLSEFHFNYIPTVVLLAAIMCLGLYCGKFFRSDASPSLGFPFLGAVIACLTTAYALAGLLLTLFVSWFDFVGYSNGSRVDRWLEGFIPALSGPFDPWILSVLTPVAVILLMGLGPLMWGWFKSQKNLAQQSALLLLATAVPCASFSLGGVLAARRVPLPGPIDPGLLGFFYLQVIVLGALSALVATLIKTSTRKAEPRIPPDDSVDLSKVLSSASQLSIFTLLLLYLSISQISSYADRVAQLIKLRQAFAFDVLHDTSDNIFHSQMDRNDMAVRRSHILEVPWAKVKILQDPPDADSYRVEVQEILSDEQWSARASRQQRLYERHLNDGNLTRAIADRLGVANLASDAAISIYPKVEAQLRSREVAVPGAGFSLDLSSFTVVAPLVVFAALVLLGARARAAIDHFSPSNDLWILLDGRNGLPGLLARLLLLALAVGPWALTVVLVQVIALMLRTKGEFETFAVDGIATFYIVAVLVLLLVSTCSAIERLLLLRVLARKTH